MTDILAPVEQEGTKAVVRAWLKAVGDRVEENDPLVELETDKVTVEVPAPAAGVLAEIVLESGAEAAPGAVLGRLASGPNLPTSAQAELVEALPFSSPKSKEGQSFDKLRMSGDGITEHRLSPSVKRALIQHSIDPAKIQGTGRGGRITRADVDAAIARGPTTSPGSAAHAEPTDTTIPSHSIPHDRMRLRIAENMFASVTQAPHVTAVFEADFSAIIAHRERHKAAFAREGAKLSYTAYLVAAAAAAMKVAPAINSRWHDDRLELYDAVNIGVGTALGEKGLIVPVLRHVERLSLKGIAAGLGGLIEKARAQKLTSDDVRGGTFTISNHGTSGSLFAAPIIINQPQSAILGVGKLEKRVVVREIGGQDAILIRPMAYVSLTIDHRVVDGHQTNAWLTGFVELLESWPAE